MQFSARLGLGMIGREQMQDRVGENGLDRKLAEVLVIPAQRKLHYFLGGQHEGFHNQPEMVRLSTSVEAGLTPVI